MFLSKSCIYGIRAVLYVATNASQDEFIPIRKISDELGISFHFLTKILQQLTNHGIMHSFRGPKGGVTLARAANDIKLIHIIEAIGCADVFNGCILGLSNCGDDNPCPLHFEWGEMKAGLMKSFSETTLEELANSIREFNFRLKEQEKDNE